ncbi:MAG: TolC family protein [Armatimonadetes bacterium]|nr:TolC family protein [Armatimonadota bacterium]
MSSSEGDHFMRKHARILFIGFGIFGFGLAQAQSPTELVQSALKNRDKIKAAQLQVAAAKNTSNSLGAFPMTRLEAGSGTRPDVAGGEELTLFQPFDLFGKSKAARQGGDADVKVAEADFRQAELTVQTEVLTAYANLGSARQNLQNSKDQLDIVKAVEAATKSRVEARALPEIQLTRAQLEVEKANQSVLDRQADFDAALVKLRQTTGISDPLETDANIEFISSPEVATGPEKRRPELLALGAQMAGLRAEEKQAKLGLAPDVELQGRRSPWADPEMYGVRLQFVVPLWDHGASRQRQQAAKRKQDATELEYADLLKQVQAEIEASKLQYEAAQKAVTTYQKLADGARDLLTKIQSGFELGASSLIEVWDAKRAYADALDELSAARLKRDLAATDLYAAEGQILGEKA